jgi:hypothetical protein
MNEVAECESFDVRFVRARYGGGKTHFLRSLAADARRSNWVTAYVLLKHGEVELDKFHTIVAEIADKLEFPDGERGVRQLLTRALDGLARRGGNVRGGQRALSVLPRCQKIIEDFCRNHGLSYDFMLFCQMAMKGFLADDSLMLAEYGNWLAGGRTALRIDPKELAMRPEDSKTRASVSQLKPLGLGDADQLVRLLALLTRQAGNVGLCLAIDELELVSGQSTYRRKNSFQTLRALVDQNDLAELPPGACLFLAATPEMFEHPDMFPSYKALQDRIETLPSLSGRDGINYRAPVIDLDKTELDSTQLRQLAENIIQVYRASGRHVPDETQLHTDRIVAAIVSSSYVIARPRLLCRCMLDLLDGGLGIDIRQEIAVRIEEMQQNREREIKCDD